MFFIVQAPGIDLEHFNVLGEGFGGDDGSTPGVTLEIDNYNAGGGMVYNTTHDSYKHLTLGTAGVEIPLAKTLNDCLNRFMKRQRESPRFV
jgi:hypothetical protein